MAATTLGPKGPVRTGEQATRIVADFLTNTSVFGLVSAWARPVSARRRQHVWLVRMDVGALVERVIEFEVDTSTGEVLRYGPK